MFKVRKSRLETITKANKRIYDKLHTQESDYAYGRYPRLKTQDIRENSIE